jgi:hypothetical protein
VNVLGTLACLVSLVLLPSPLQAEWFETKRAGDLVYCFFDDAQPKVEVYALTSGEWQSTITLPGNRGTPTAAHATGSTLFIAYGSVAYRYDLPGGNETLVSPLFAKADNILSTGNLVFFTGLDRDGFVTSVSATTNAVLDTEFVGIGHPDLLEEEGLIVGNRTLRYGGGGQLTRVNFSALPSVDQDDFTKPYPSGSRIIDSAGGIYNRIARRKLGRQLDLGNPVTDAAFYGRDTAILLGGTRVAMFGNDYRETGALILPREGRGIFVHGEQLTAFMPDAESPRGIATITIDLADLNAPDRGSRVNPTGLDYTIDDLFEGNDGRLYLFSSEFQSIFCRDPDTKRYGESVLYDRMPARVTYQPDSNTVFSVYKGPGNVLEFAKRELGGSRESLLAVITPLSTESWDEMVATSDFLVTTARRDRYVFNARGAIVETHDRGFNNTRIDLTWNEPTSTIFFYDFGNDALGAWPVPASGVIGEPSVGISATGSYEPLRVAPSGTLLATADGSTWSYNGSTRTFAKRSQFFPGDVADMTWTPANDLFSIRETNGDTKVESWLRPNLGPGVTRQVEGTPHRILTLSDHTLAVITIGSDGVPLVHHFDTDLNTVPATILDSPGNLSALITHPDWGNGSFPDPNEVAITLTWDHVVGEPDYRVERRILPAGPWLETGSTSSGTTTFEDTAVTLGSGYEYRVVATNEVTESPPSAPLPVDFASPGNPSGLTIEDLESNTLTIRWTPDSTASGFALEQRAGPSASWSPSAFNVVGPSAVQVINLLPGTSHEFRLRLENPLGVSGWITGSATTLLPPPVTPTPFRATGLLAYRVVLSWNQREFETYVLERREPNGDWAVIHEGPERVFYDYEVTPEAQYEYRVKAVNARGESAYATLNAITIPALHAPGPPSNLTARNVEGIRVLLDWEDPFITDTVKIERRTDGPAPWAVIATVPSSAPSEFLDENVQADFQYDYRVTAFNAAGTSHPASATVFVIDGTCLLEGNFHDGNLPAWTSTSGGQVIIDGGQGFPEGGVLWFGQGGIRSFETAPLDVQQGGLLEIRLRAGNATVDGYDYWDDSEWSDRLFLQYSTDGLLWFNHGFLQLDEIKDWTNEILALGSASWSPATRFRLIQPGHSGPSFDTWAIESFCFFGKRVENQPPEFASTTPTVLTTNAAAEPLVLDLST